MCEKEDYLRQFSINEIKAHDIKHKIFTFTHTQFSKAEDR